MVSSAENRGKRVTTVSGVRTDEEGREYKLEKIVDEEGDITLVASIIVPAHLAEGIEVDFDQRPSNGNQRDY